MNENWAIIAATRTVNSTGFLGSPIASITALLHQVVDECEHIARSKSRELDKQGCLVLATGAYSAANAIRAKFPKEDA